MPDDDKDVLLKRLGFVLNTNSFAEDEEHLIKRAMTDLKWTVKLSK